MNTLSYDTSVPKVASIIETASDSTPIIVDLDETLFLRNSTQEYLDTLRPRILGYLLLALLNFLKPWNWLPGKIKGEVSRDWVKVFVATLLFPWTLILWEWRAKELAQAYVNTILLDALTKKANSRVIVATQGFDFIVRSLCKHFPIEFHRVIACRFWQGAIDRERGKYSLVSAFLTKDELNRAIAITDSTDDNPLLASVATPCLVTWPEANYVSALANIYIPFLYLERAKRPGNQYFLRKIVYDDFLILILGMSWVNKQPLIHATGMFFLLLSFWCIYELGYVENDIVAERFEKQPTLSATYQQYINRINVWQAWIWAVTFAVPGVIILELAKVISIDVSLASIVSTLDLQTALINMVFWIGLLLVVRLTFFIYNYIDKQTRTWLHFVLQTYKYFGFLVVTKTNIIGSMLFVAQVVSVWIPYFVHRYTKSKWPEELPHEMLRVFLFGFLVIAITLGTQNISILISWQTLVIFVWYAYRARRRLLKLVREIHPISQDIWDIKN